MWNAVFLIAAIGADPLQPLGRLSDPAIREASGIVKSRKHPGRLLGPQRLGQPPGPLRGPPRRPLAARRTGSPRPNVDWEDIATDDAGHLYIGDIGNNGGLLPLRADLPDRRARPARGRPKADLPIDRRQLLPVLLEGRAVRRRGRCSSTADRASIVAKTFDGRDAEVFAVPLDPPRPCSGPALPRAGRIAARLRRAGHRGRPLGRRPAPGRLSRPAWPASTTATPTGGWTLRRDRPLQGTATSRRSPGTGTT